MPRFGRPLLARNIVKERETHRIRFVRAHVTLAFSHRGLFCPYVVVVAAALDLLFFLHHPTSHVFLLSRQTSPPLPLSLPYRTSPPYPRVMPPTPDPHGNEDILRVIQAQIDRENGVGPPASAGVPTNHWSDNEASNEENESPEEDWDATREETTEATREPFESATRETDEFRERLDIAKAAVERMSNSTVLLDEIEEMAKDFDKQTNAHKLELEQVAKLNGVTLTEEEEILEE